MNTQTHIHIEGRQIGNPHPLFPKQPLSVPAEWLNSQSPITLKTFISHLVTNEVTAFQQRQTDRQIVRLLTATQIETSKPSGRIDPAAKKIRQQVDLPSALRTALQAFEDGLFFVFIDGEQKKSLDDPISLTADSHIRFIRLVALAGG